MLRKIILPHVNNTALVCYVFLRHEVTVGGEGSIKARSRLLRVTLTMLYEAGDVSSSAAAELAKTFYTITEKSCKCLR